MSKRPTPPDPRPAAPAGPPATFPAPGPLPPECLPALAIVERLCGAGHVAYFAGGCVRDLLLGREPSDFDVATSATPEQVCGLFRATRRVGAHFGVVLVKSKARWVEVATFRSDASYLDGRRPVAVTFTDPEHDAQRRDFTVNGMFLEPRAARVIDYVGGRADLDAKIIRAIGDPAARFAEDHLRLLRAVRFAAGLGFALDPATASALRAYAGRLELVSAERIREELEKLLSSAGRARGLALLAETGLIGHLWAGAAWTREQIAAAQDWLARLPEACDFETALAACLLDRPAREVDAIARALACSNEQRESLLWLVAHAHDLAHPDAPSLADLKRLLGHADFPRLRQLTQVLHDRGADGAARRAQLEKRVAAIRPESVQPPPLVTGDDLLARSVPAGPIYKRLLDELYTLQLDETIATRTEALAWLERRLAESPQ